jgi:hypothetical protein
MMLEIALSLGASMPAGKGGWIGWWKPGIGDPTPVGWFTVALYFSAAVLAGVIVYVRRRELRRAERHLWQVMLLGLLGLGANKQLDLQSALTELGRLWAYDQGWYEHRHKVQKVFILAVALLAVGLGTLMLALIRRMPPATRVAALGACALLGFVLIRASSFHHVDLFIHASFWGGIRGNWLIEVGGLLVILGGQLWRLVAPARSSAAPDACGPLVTRQ